MKFFINTKKQSKKNTTMPDDISIMPAGDIEINLGDYFEKACNDRRMEVARLAINKYSGYTDLPYHITWTEHNDLDEDIQSAYECLAGADGVYLNRYRLFFIVCQRSIAQAIKEAEGEDNE